MLTPVDYCRNNGAIGTLNNCMRHSLSKDICAALNICTFAYENIDNTTRAWRLWIAGTQKKTSHVLR